MPSPQPASPARRARPRARGVWRRFVWLLWVVSLLLGLLAAGAAWLWWKQPLPLAAATVEWNVEPGDAPRQVARTMAAAGVQWPAEALWLGFRWSGEARGIRAGSYSLKTGETAHEALQKMLRGDEVLESLRILEGWTLRQMRAELARSPHLRATTQHLSDAELMAALDAPGQAAEGAFFPDTYRHGKGVSDLTVLRRAHRAMQQRLQAAWAERDPQLPLASPVELLTLASIVEKETGREADRGLVAGVFANRLRMGMRLQTDPSVIYGLGEHFDGNLRKAHLLADTPFNTYTRTGLPPTPIALPGLASLRAAARPAATRALYFVARGDGSSQFSDTLEAHNRAVNRYQR